VTDLIPLTALGATELRSERFGALTIAEDESYGLASLTLRKGQSAPTPFGLTLPKAGIAAQSDGTSAIWTGPDQWLILGAGQAQTDFAAEVLTQMPQASVTEQTDGLVCFDIRSDAGGLPITALMSKLVNLPPEAYATGRATRTGLEHMTVFLYRRDEGHLSILGMRSYAGSLWHALVAAAERGGATKGFSQGV
jgi:sarcosine oxidase subunit gamma